MQTTTGAIASQVQLDSVQNRRVIEANIVCRQEEIEPVQTLFFLVPLFGRQLMLTHPSEMMMMTESMLWEEMTFVSRSIQWILLIQYR